MVGQAKGRARAKSRGLWDKGQGHVRPGQGQRAGGGRRSSGPGGQARAGEPRPGKAARGVWQAKEWPAGCRQEWPDRRLRRAAAGRRQAGGPCLDRKRPGGRLSSRTPRRKGRQKRRAGPGPVRPGQALERKRFGPERTRKFCWGGNDRGSKSGEN